MIAKKKDAKKSQHPLMKTKTLRYFSFPMKTFTPFTILFPNLTKNCNKACFNTGTVQDLLQDLKYKRQERDNKIDNHLTWQRGPLH